MQMTPVMFVPGILVLGLALAVIGLLIAGVIKLLFSPQSSHVVKVLILVPLALVGALVLAFVVLTASYRFTGVERPATATIQVDDPRNGSEVCVSPSGVSVKTAQGRHVSVAPYAVSVQSSGAATVSSPPKGTNAWGGSGVLRAVNKAFVTAARSTIGKGESAAQGPALPRTEAPPARAESASGQLDPTAAKRPDWVENPPQPRAELYEMVVKAGPWKTRPECDQELDEKIAWAVDSYVTWRIGDEAGSQVQLPDDYARSHLVREQWLERVNTSLGEMYNMYALLSFDRQVEGKLQDTWNQIVLGARLLVSAAVLAGVLLILTVVYGYLKIDLATAGAYRGRLRFLAAATMVALAVVGVKLWRQGVGQ